MMKIDQILSQLSLEQKARLCSGADAWNTCPLEQAGIPSVLMTDGPHGLRKQYDKSTAMLEQSVPATCFPAAATTACSWDRALLSEIGRALGAEARDQEISMVLGPGINIKRSPLCGRNFEYFSEDPMLAGELGAAMIEGIQSTGVGACLKHFAANNRESFRMVSNSIVDERALHEIYLSGFERAVKKAKPYAVMSAYNMLNGTYCGETPTLIHDTLRKDWGFEGLVVSDWGACYNREKGIAAGLDLEMPYSGEENTERIIRAVQSGSLPESALDDCVRHLLAFLERCETWKKLPYFYQAEQNHMIARKAAAESAVLLKNEQTLPLPSGTKIALLGEFAEKPRYQGAGSSMINPIRLENALDSFREYGIEYQYAKGYSISENDPNELQIKEAETIASQCDAAVIIAGLPPRCEIEGIDRAHLHLPQNQVELITRISKIKPVILLLCCGAPVEMPWLSSVSALVCCYLSGEAGASAMAQILTGEINPSGKLAETWPRVLSDTPSFRFFSDDRHNIEYRESIYVGYRYYDAARKEVLFPFGFGLSYTTFEYSDLKVTQQADDAGLLVTVSALITNTGKRSGAEVVQCYVQEDGSLLKQLRGFEKIFLAPGERKRVSFALTNRDFSFYSNGWKLMQKVHILVGASSCSLPLGAEVSFQSGTSSPVYPVAHDGHWDSSSFYRSFQHLPSVSFHIRPFTINATLKDFDSVAIGRMAHRFIARFVKKHMNPGGYHTHQIMLQLLEENPLRVLVSMSGGLFTYGMARGVLMIVNGQIFMGLLAFFSAFRKRKKHSAFLK